MKDNNSSFAINHEQYPGTNEINTGRTQYAKVDTSNFQKKSNNKQQL